MIRDALQKIGLEYPNARLEKFAEHPLADFIRSDSVIELKTAVGADAANLEFKGSAGAGNFASIPWLAIFDPIVTDSATRGYYVVYLFAADGQTVYLSLNQGTTSVREEFKREAPQVLRDRAALIRNRLKDFQSHMSGEPIQLGSRHSLPRGYEEGHALGFAYNLINMPTEQQLVADLTTVIAAYRRLTFRGGLDPSPEGSAEVGGDLPVGTPATIDEIRRYRMHRKVERNPRAAAIAKRVHGTICQGCGFDFSKKYGALGEGYIEAHHLRSMASLAENVVVSLKVADDFAVLCSNCHRMIHRTNDSSDLAGFRSHIKKLS